MRRGPDVRTQVIELGACLLDPLDGLWALPVAAFNADDGLMAGDFTDRNNIDLTCFGRGDLHQLDRLVHGGPVARKLSQHGDQVLEFVRSSGHVS